MDDVLTQAMAPVLRDLQASGLRPPRIEDKDWTDDAASPSVWLWSPDGSGMGIRVDRDAAECDRIARVADQVQEWVIEELWGQAPTNWPPCPRHPDNHPLRASTREHVATWVCPADEVPVVAIGRL